MSHVEISRHALLDLDQIWSYIARDAIEPADVSSTRFRQKWKCSRDNL